MNPKKSRNKAEKLIYCPYCKEPLKYEGIGIYARCDNHSKDIEVEFKYLYNLYWIKIVKDKWQIYIYENYMELCKDYYRKNILPIDKNLTPENFEQKLKLYLTFQ